jgi:NAD(P)-dependent dehydrogenase (short-subunit alcohol dehydrogenase family)
LGCFPCEFQYIVCFQVQTFKGKGAIVTGAASGIGLGLARALARSGANVALADIDAEGLEKARAELARNGTKIVAQTLDVADESAVRAAAAEFEAQLGKVHLLFNNAGVEMSGALESLETRDWQWLLGVNVFGVIHGIRHFLPLLRRHGEGGHVVNTASIGGLQVNRDFRLGPYAMTKYAVVALSEALEQDLEGSGIGVSVLCPGSVATRIAESSRRPNAALRAAVAAGMTPGAVAERVLRAIRDREFYVFTHTELKPKLEARFRRILEAFSRISK